MNKLVEVECNRETADLSVARAPTLDLAALRWHGPASILLYLTCIVLLVCCLLPDRTSGFDPTVFLALITGVAFAPIFGFIVAMFRRWWRFPLVLVGLAGLASLVPTKVHFFKGELVWLIPGLGAQVFLGIELAKRFGWVFHFASDGIEGSEGLSFGVRHLFFGMTATAIFCSFGHWLVWLCFYMFWGVFEYRTISFGIGFQTILLTTFLGVGALLGRRSIIRILTWLVLSLILPVAVSIAVVRQEDALSIAMLICPVIVLVNIFLLTLRFEGIRFMKAEKKVDPSSGLQAVGETLST